MSDGEKLNQKIEKIVNNVNPKTIFTDKNTVMHTANLLGELERKQIHELIKDDEI
jgi:hypothetical protein